MTINRLKIFVSAYACEPDLGSEVGVGWHWVLEMSKYFDLWVLTRETNQKSIEEWLMTNQFQNKVHFIYFDLPKRFRFWKKGLRGVRLYYMLWQKLSNRIVKRIMETNEIEIYHLLTYGNAHWPVSKYGQMKFFIWGPTAAGDYIPYEYSKYYSCKWQLIEASRRILSRTLPYNPGFRKKCKNADLILCKTETTLNNIPLSYRNKATIFTDVAVEHLDVSSFIKEIKEDDLIRYLAVGRLAPWRGFDILVEAFSKAILINQKIRLEIIGFGSDYRRLNQIRNNLNVQDYITLSGKVTRDQYYCKMAQSDVVVNPSLREGAVTVSFDSISFGKPLICIETGGYTNSFNNDYAIVLRRSSRPELIENLCNAIIKMSDPDIRRLKCEKTLGLVSKYSWEKKGEHIYRIINDAFNSLKY